MSVPIYRTEIDTSISYWGLDQTLEKSGTATSGIGVTSHQGTYTFDGAKTSSTSQSWRCKLDGTLARTVSSTTLGGWSRDIALTGGHTYRVTITHLGGSVTIGSHNNVQIALNVSNIVARHYLADGLSGSFDYCPESDCSALLLLGQTGTNTFSGLKISIGIRDLTAAINYELAAKTPAPVFFPETATSFTTHGIGPCTEATRCEVHEELNGQYELTLEMPATARHFSEVGTRTIILAKPNPYDNPQPFRIYRPVKTSKYNITYDAHHISYDLDGYPVSPFTAANAQQAVLAITNNQLVNTGQPWAFATDLTQANTGDMKVEVPTGTRELLGNGENTLVGTYGGTLYFDGFSVYLLDNRGQDRGFVIAYGKNLVDLEQETNISDLYNAVMPYAKWHDGVYTGNIEMAPGTWNYYRVKTVDFSSDVSSYLAAPTQQQLSNLAQGWLYSEKPWEPRVSIKLTTVPPGSEGLQSLQDLRLGDPVTVRFLRLGIEVTDKVVVGYTYDVLRQRYISVEIGEKPRTAADAISDASRLTKGEISPERIRGGSIGAGKLSGDVQGKLNTMVTNPFSGTFDTSGLKFDGWTVAWKSMTYFDEHTQAVTSTYYLGMQS